MNFLMVSTKRSKSHYFNHQAVSRHVVLFKWCMSNAIVFQGVTFDFHDVVDLGKLVHGLGSRPKKVE